MNNPVNVYLDINPLTKKPFYIGVGCAERCQVLKRNIFHSLVVNNLPGGKFERRLIYKDISPEQAYRVEIQVIAKCGRVCNGSGFLTNIHPGGPLEMNVGQGGHPLKGKNYTEVYGGDLANVIIAKQVLKRTKAVLTRHQISGLSEREIERYKKMKDRHDREGLSEREQAGHQQVAERRCRGEYTPAELAAHQACKDRQANKTMAERLGVAKYVSPKSGKTMAQITNNPNYVSPRKGAKMVDIMGPDYVDPKSKPFVLVINKKDTVMCNSETDCLVNVKLSAPILSRLKKESTYIVKRQSNSKHAFQTGDLIEFRWQ